MKKSSQHGADQTRDSIPHSRVYTSGLTAAGEQVLMLGVGASPGQPSVTELMGQGEIITEAEIRAWSVRLPFPLNGDDLAKLADALNLMRVTVHPKDAIAPQQEAAMRRVIKHIDGLSRELPALIEFGRKFGSAGAGSCTRCVR